MSPRRTKAAMIATFTALAIPAHGQDTPLNVLATVGMVGDVVQNVAGTCANVTTLIGPGTDPHYFSATPRDVDALAQAELIFYVDRTLEERLADILDNFRNRTPTLGLAGATFDTETLLEDPDEPGTLDPHLWMDVSRWARIAPVIANEIAALRPDCAEDMADNVSRYSAQLDALHGWVGDAIASIPEGQRLLVTAHDAFYYFADAYGVEASEAIEGISTASEASIGDIREVAAFVIDRAVPAVFVETTINPRTIEALVAEVQAQGHDVEIGGELFSDALGDEGTAEGTYIGMIRANTLTVTQALGGTVPDWPEALHDWAQDWDIAH
ncbi:zinc ABC transporter substrate-binding protein [Roseinatronobacter sp.]|uniref:metal ABC transporter solute-binding protein, Zn/Mn family n=1 Tax=Roseinatronobacter sp. TaxID=1945755 RepID=UPI0025F0C765|nr:zinc ABC transporter substrate-binding protein [Rhodobaca sp.]